jgi:hypothetical protein
VKWVNPIDWAQAQPCTLAGHDDCHYWGLTLGQCFDYHGRLRVYHRERAEALWERYERGNTFATRFLQFALGLAVGNAVFQVVQEVAQ